MLYVNNKNQTIEKITFSFEWEQEQQKRKQMGILPKSPNKMKKKTNSHPPRLRESQKPRSELSMLVGSLGLNMVCIY